MRTRMRIRSVVVAAMLAGWTHHPAAAQATLPATSQPTSAGLAMRLAGSASADSEMAGVSDLPITSSPTWNSVTPVPT